MQSMLAQNARELLELEKNFQKGGLTDNQAARWREVASNIFAGNIESSNQRISFRLPIQISVTVRFQKEIIDCMMKNASQIGMLLVANAFKKAVVGDVITISTWQLQNKTVPFDLDVRVVNCGSLSSSPSVGVSILQLSEAYHEKIYYPLYISFLEHLSQTR